MARPHRHDDLRACGGKTIATRQSTVFINDRLAAVRGDPNNHGAGYLRQGVNDGTILVENRPLAFAGDPASADGLCKPPTPIHCRPRATEGSNDVTGF